MGLAEGQRGRRRAGMAATAAAIIVSASLVAGLGTASAEPPEPTPTASEPASGPDATTYQTITTEVLPGQLSLTVPSSVVTMPTVTLTGYDQIISGALNSVTVVDPRGTSAGWNLTAQVSDFVSANGVIVADNLGWVPNASVTADTLPLPPETPASSVTAGPTAAPGSGLGDAAVLCSSPTGASAGTFTCGAELNLGIPGSTRSGTYTGVLTLTLV